MAQTLTVVYENESMKHFVKVALYDTLWHFRHRLTNPLQQHFKQFEGAYYLNGAPEWKKIKRVSGASVLCALDEASERLKKRRKVVEARRKHCSLVVQKLGIKHPQKKLIENLLTNRQLLNIDLSLSILKDYLVLTSQDDLLVRLQRDKPGLFKEKNEKGDKKEGKKKKKKVKEEEPEAPILEQ